MSTNIVFLLMVLALAIETARGICQQEGDRCRTCTRGTPCVISIKGTCNGDECKAPKGKCFPGNTVVTTDNGDVIKMSDVKIGDKIATVSPSGGHIFSEVRAFMHHETDIIHSYLRLETSSGKHIVLSHSHVIFMAKSNEPKDMENKFAEEVEIGDYIFYVDQSNGFIPEIVVSKTSEKMEGAYAPLTTEGTLLVNDVYASCYAAISHKIAHVAMTPMRWFPWIFDSDIELQGARPFVNFMKQFGIYVLPDQYLTQKYRSKGQKIISVYETPASIVERKCANIKQNYNMFTRYVTCQK